MNSTSRVIGESGLASRPTRWVSNRRRRVRAVMISLVFAFLAAMSINTASASQARAAFGWELPIECSMTPWMAGNLSMSEPSAIIVGSLGKPKEATLWKQNPDQTVQVGNRDPQWTLYEQMGMSGTTWSTTVALQQETVGDGQKKFSEIPGVTDEMKRDPHEECSAAAPMLTLLANFVFSFSKIVISLVIAFRGWATDPEPFLGMMDKLTGPLERAAFGQTGFWLGMVTIALIITGIQIIAAGLGSADRQRTALRAGLMALVFVALGAVLMIKMPAGQDNAGKPVYYALTKTGMDLTDGFSAAFADKVIGSGSNADVCAATGPDSARRTLDCQIYRTVIFDVWVQGQFGPQAVSRVATDPKTGTTSTNTDGVPFMKEVGPGAEQRLSFGKDAAGWKPGTDARVVQMWAQGPTSREVLLDGRARDCGNEKKKWECRVSGPQMDFIYTYEYSNVGAWNIVRDYMWHYQHNTYDTWRGADAGTRLGLAVMSTLMALLIGVFIVTVSALALMWNCVLVVLWFALPFVAAISIIPAVQTLFKQWLQTWVTALVLSFIYQITMVFALFMMSIVLGMPDVGLGWQALAMVMLTLALFKVLKMAKEGKFSANLSGGASVFDPGTAANAFKKGAKKVSENPLARRAGGAVVAGGTAAVAGGVARRKAGSLVRPGVTKFNKARKGKLRRLTDEGVTARELAHLSETGESMSMRDRAKAQREARREALAEVGDKKTVAGELGDTGAGVGDAMKEALTAGRHSGRSALGAGLGAANNSAAAQALARARGRTAEQEAAERKRVTDAAQMAGRSLSQHPGESNEAFSKRKALAEMKARKNMEATIAAEKKRAVEDASYSSMRAQRLRERANAAGTRVAGMGTSAATWSSRRIKDGVDAAPLIGEDRALRRAGSAAVAGASAAHHAVAGAPGALYRGARETADRQVAQHWQSKVAASLERGFQKEEGLHGTAPQGADAVAARRAEYMARQSKAAAQRVADTSRAYAAAKQEKQQAVKDVIALTEKMSRGEASFSECEQARRKLKDVSQRAQQAFRAGRAAERESAVTAQLTKSETAGTG